MHDRHDLTDEQWEILETLLPGRTPVRGGQWKDHRQVINGVMWRTRAGAPWRDFAVPYGRWKTVYNRHRRWSADGTWERSWTVCGLDGPWVLTAAQAQAILDACVHLRDRFLFVLLLNTVLRIGETLGLRHEDLDIAETQVAVLARDNDNRARAKGGRGYGQSYSDRRRGAGTSSKATYTR